METFAARRNQSPKTGPKRRIGWYDAAIVLGILAGAAVIVGGAYGLVHKAVFEHTAADLFGSHIGSQLLVFMALPAGLLIVAIVSIWVLRGRNAEMVAACAATVSLVLAVGGIVHAYRQLHPTLAAERAALAAFVSPPGAVDVEDTTDVTATPSISRIWDVPGSPPTVCADLEAELRAWAARDTEQPIPRPTQGCSFTAQKGSYQAVLYGLYGLPNHPVSVSLTLTRAN
jgi:hypothetical protein